MAPQTAAPPVSALRAVSYRISSTPTKQLPRVIPQITTSLTACKQLLAFPQDAKATDSSDAAVAVHKFSTQLSTLLQDRTIEGRWAAVVLVKCTVELGEHEVLQRCAPWVGGLLNILGRPDPPTTRKLCIIALTRIFVLTRDHPSLVREVTTPSLPTMISSCLKIFTAGSQSPSVQQTPTQRALLHTVLESFSQLLPRHPTIFRSYQSQLQQLVVQVVAPTPSSSLQHNHAFPHATCEAAQRLLVQTHCCAPKSTSTEEWDKLLKATVTSTHRTADKVFRAVIEDWEPVSGVLSTNNNIRALEEEVHESGPDAMGLPGWTGLFAGSERMVGLLRLLTQFICTPTAAAVGLRVGLVTDLLTRVFSLTIPSNADTAISQASVRFNNQVGREERENLWVVLPHIHAVTAEILGALIERFTDAVYPTLHVYLDQLISIFRAEITHDTVRTSIYRVVTQLVNILGPSMTNPSVDTLSQIVQSVCSDLLYGSEATRRPSDQANGLQTRPPTTIEIPLGSAAAPKSSAAAPEGLISAAYSLLPVILAKIPAQHISVPLRTLMDRTAILLHHKEAMLSSVINPPLKRGSKGASSILRLLATSFPESLEVEGFLRPRMPVIRTSTDDDGAMLLDEDEVKAREEKHTSPQPFDTAVSLQKGVSPEQRAASAMVMGGDLPVVPLGDGDSNGSAPQIQQGISSDLLTATEGPATSRSVKRSEPPTTDLPPSPKRTRHEMPAPPSTAPQPLPQVITAVVSTPASAADASESKAVNIVPATVPSPETLHEATLPQQPPLGSILEMAGADVAGDDDDDDDFEIPSLTMDQDTSEAEGDSEDE